MAGHELVVGLVDVEVDGEFGFGGDDFVGGHRTTPFFWGFGEPFGAGQAAGRVGGLSERREKTVGR